MHSSITLMWFTVMLSSLTFYFSGCTAAINLSSFDDGNSKYFDEDCSAQSQPLLLTFWIKSFTIFESITSNKSKSLISNKNSSSSSSPTAAVSSFQFFDSSSSGLSIFRWFLMSYKSIVPSSAENYTAMINTVCALASTVYLKAFYMASK